MKFIQVEYNQDLKALEKVLSGVKRQGDFVVNGAMEIPMPQVDVEGVGTLSFPVPDAQIQAVIRKADRAPYGKGEKTILDTSVRKVWQIAPGKVRIGGKSWETNFEALLSKVRAGLGCEGLSVSADLYKLLVYDREGFFLPHRDTEKTDGMFGTLVITLPSVHRGGELRIRHAGREVTVDTSATEFSELSYVAFYADCEHEALPVREGNRVCLVYNLVQKRGKTKSRILKAPGYESEILEAAGILDRSLKAADAPAKIAWLLEHQYSPAGLLFSGLKGADAARAGVLRQAAAPAQCVVHLGIVHIEEFGGAEPDFDDDAYGWGWNRYHDDEEEEDEDEDGSETETFTVISVDDSWRYVDQWRGSDDSTMEFGRIPLEDGELLPDGALDEEPPDSRKLTEASGNEGASYERSYHRAALVLWRRDRYAEVLLQAGVVAALPYLKQLTAGGKKMRPEALSLAKRMATAWRAGSKQADYHSAGGDRPESSHRIEMIAELEKLGAATLLEGFIANNVIPHYDGAENAVLVSSVNVLGNKKAAAVLSALVSTRMPNRPNECAELVLDLTAESSRCFPEIAESIVAGLDRMGKKTAEMKTFGWVPEERARPLDPPFLINIFKALRRFKTATFCDAAAAKIAARPEVFSPVTLVVPALEQIPAAQKQKSTTPDSSILHLWMRSAEFLLRRSEVPPVPPSNWRLDVKLSCSCPDCKELQSFATDSAERVHRFRVKKERRQHLHSEINKHHLDMTHVTERTGSPQTLVCTKDRRTFNRRMKQYGHEVAAMRTLVRLAPGYDATNGLSERMKAAVKRAADGE